MTAGDASKTWSWLQLLAAAMIGLGWIVAILMLISTEGPPTSTWLILLSSSISVFASRLQRTWPGLSTTLLMAAAVVAIAAIVVSIGQ